MKTITYNPETHVLVPREPSEEMIRRGCLTQSETAHPTYESWWDSHSSGISERIRLYLKKDYQAMIEAAPQPEPNQNWCAGCSPDNCSGCGTEPVCEWVKADGANYLRQKWHKDYVAVEGDKLYTTPQPDRTAELETALKVARDTIKYYSSVCGEDDQPTPAKETLAKINEVLK